MCVCLFVHLSLHLFIQLGCVRVAVGVKHFKNGDLDRAMKLFDHALDIDPCNVEGLVARGAL